MKSILTASALAIIFFSPLRVNAEWQEIRTDQGNLRTRLPNARFRIVLPPGRWETKSFVVKNDYGTTTAYGLRMNTTNPKGPRGVGYAMIDVQYYDDPPSYDRRFTVDERLKRDVDAWVSRIINGLSLKNPQNSRRRVKLQRVDGIRWELEGRHGSFRTKVDGASYYDGRRYIEVTVLLEARGNNPFEFSKNDVGRIHESFRFLNRPSQKRSSKRANSKAQIDEAAVDDEILSNVKALIRRGNHSLKQMEYDKAIADFTEAIRLDPKNAKAYRSRGVAWAHKQEFAKAIEGRPKQIAIPLRSPEIPVGMHLRRLDTTRSPLTFPAREMSNELLSHLLTNS